MKSTYSRSQAILLAWTLIFGLSNSILAHAVSFSTEAANIANAPLYIGANIPPLVMLDISKDQQLFKKAYNDYSDLDGDGQLETTYKHSIDYYGYFDPYKCYDYSTANSRFEPSTNTTTKYCTSKWSGNFLNWVTMSRMDAVRKLLYGGLRSTDQTFASGGANAITVLERSYLPTDAHSWAKHYNGSDIAQLTPFNPPVTPTAVTSATSNSIGTGAKIFNVGASTTKFSYGDQVIVRDTASPTANYMIGAVSCVNGTGINMYNSLVASSNTCAANEIKVVVEAPGVFGTGTKTSWSVENWTQTGISFCNTTKGVSATDTSQANTNPPLTRVAQGNFALWAANERWQCYWREDAPSENTGSLSGATSTQGNRASQSGLFASSIGPNKTTLSSGRITNGLGSQDYVVRIKACVPGLIGTEKCKLYPAGNYKPTGLLQVYGDPGLLQFGLMTGSYKKNVSGGVLRKNIGPVTDEINAIGGTTDSGDGTFKTPAASVGSIITTLNKMRIYGYYYGDGTYLGATGDNCTWQQTSITEGTCTSWGNPMAEIFYESLRYFAGKSPTGAYTYTAGSTHDDTLGLPLPSWTDPLNTRNYCAPLNVVVFNASVSTNEDSVIPSGSTKNSLASTTMTDIGGTLTVAAKTNIVGDNENITGNGYFLGKMVGTSPTASTDPGFELCSVKTVGKLGDVAGICPEGPTLDGTYLLPGLAFQAHTQQIRSTLPNYQSSPVTYASSSSLVPSTDTKSLTISTYGVQLATNVPKLVITVPGSTQQVIIQPAYRLFNSAPQGGGTLVDMKVVSQTTTANTTSGTIYLNWEDSEQGGDYDQDMWGVLGYCLTTVANGCGSGTLANTIQITTNTVAYSTANPQGFGYIISGTTQDGPHFHSGILGFNFTDPKNITIVSPSPSSTAHVNASGGCTGCVETDVATVARYTLATTTTAEALQDPLFYAAKWGGFKEAQPNTLNPKDGNKLPDQISEWDIKTTTGASGSDGIPDNYFLVNNPLNLESALDKTFVAILATSSASSVATNSTSLNTGSRIYQARFNSNDWSGNLFSLSISTSGVVACAPPDCACTTPGCVDSAERITTTQPWNSRTILTLNDSTNAGAPFLWANISANQHTALNKNGSGVTDTLGPQRLTYLRGDASNEGTSSTNFRKRSTTKLGDIVNSNPQYVGPPNSGYADSFYAAFRSNYIHRTPMVYVGANDGMLHGFNACPPSNTNCTSSTNQGKELIAYIPSKTYANLSMLGEQNYINVDSHRYFVDGTPGIEDVYINTGGSNQWRTVLVGSMGAGGQGIFALDVTNPDDGTQTAPTFSESNAANLTLWEFTDANDADLGYTYGQPQIAKMANGKWAAIFGNGYNSTYSCAGPAPCATGPVDTHVGSGHAVLYILFIEQGIGGTWTPTSGYIKIDTNPTNLASLGDISNPNGMSTPFAADINGDDVVDHIYAGDLLGNLWKFDVTNSNPALWGTSFSGQPLFTALDTVSPTPNPQPIVTRPEVAPHPNGGYFVLFGTGKYLEKVDANNQLKISPQCPLITSPTQPCFYGESFYGIWDQQNLTGGTVPISGRGNLLQQSILGTTTVNNAEYRVTTADNPASPTDWSVATGQKGWYMDFPGNNTSNLSTTGERVVYSPIVRGNRVIFTTLIPSADPCKAGGDSWLMELNVLTGSRLLMSPFDVDQNGVFNSSDQVTFSSQNVYVSGRKSTIGITPTPTVIGAGSNSGTPPTKEYKITSGSSGKTESIVESTGGGTFGRITWRELLGN